MTNPDLILKGFNKVDEDTDPELLGIDELASLSNMVLDYPGKMRIPKKRGGLQKFDTGSTANSIISLHSAIDSAGANYLFAGLGTTKMMKSVVGSGAWSDLKTGLTTSLRTRITPTSEGRYIITNGTDAPFIVGGAAFASNWNLEIARPDMQGVSIAISPGGDLDASAYYAYILVYVTDTGEMSDISQPLLEVTTADKTLDLQDIPVSADTRVKGRKIYRTEGGGTTFYLLASIDNVQTTYVDTRADTELDTSESITLINMPTKVKFITTHRDRAFLGYISKTRKHDIQSPYAFPFTLTQGAAGNIADGVYKYKYSHVDKDGLESEASVYQTITIAAGGGTASVTLGLSYPFIGADRYQRNNDITAIRVYRTKVGGSTYYYVKDIRFYTTDTAIDTLNDTSLTDEYPYNSAVALATTEKTYKNAVMFSDVLAYSQIPAINFINIAPNDNDEITGIFDDTDGVVVFKKNSIFKIYTNGSPTNWAVKKIVDTIGCDEAESMFKKDTSIFFTKNKRPYRYSGGSIEYLGKGLQASFNQVTVFNSTCYSTSKDWLVFAVQISTAHYLFIYDFKLGTWYKFTTDLAYCLLELKSTTAAGFLLIGKLNYVYYYVETGVCDYNNADAAVAISTTIRSKTFTFPDGLNEARLRKLWVNYKSTYHSSGNGAMHYLYNPDNGEYKTQSEVNTANDPKRYEVVTDQMTGDLQKCPKFYYEMTGEGVNEFYSFKLEYRILPKRLYQDSNPEDYLDILADCEIILGVPEDTTLMEFSSDVEIVLGV